MISIRCCSLDKFEVCLRIFTLFVCSRVWLVFSLYTSVRIYCTRELYRTSWHLFVRVCVRGLFIFLFFNLFFFCEPVEPRCELDRRELTE